MSNFDVEDQSILSAIFKDSFEESWTENPEFAQYLSELSSYGVDKLGREPERLAEERAQILQQTQDLAFHNYKTFIQTADCSRDIFQDFQIIEKHVDSLLQKLPGLSESCSGFMDTAHNISVSRRMNTVTLGRHTQLLEVLEIPQLMDTCVRNAYYEEALELAAHVKRLEKKHSNITVIVNIVREVQGCMQLMLNQLLQQLRSSIQLPACLKVIGYLRRMDVFTEPELRIKFLQARDAWFQNILDAIPADDSYYHINKTIEASRVHLFDIITQYRAIFSDEDPLLTTTRDDVIGESAIFHGWVLQKVSQFLSTLEHDLMAGAGSSGAPTAASGVGGGGGSTMAGRLDTLLGQCMYFGLSFSRVGADFRSLLAAIFQRATMHSFTIAINAADQRFSESMQSYTLLGTPAPVPSTAYSLTSQGGSIQQPPLVLLQYPPLATYCNQLLTALNDLRLCAPLSLACNVAANLHQSLQNCVQTILAYHRAEDPTFNDQEKAKFTAFCGVFAEELVPYISRCLQLLFPPSQLAQMLGISASDVLKMGHIGCLDCESVTQPLGHLLPVKQTLEVPAASETGGTEAAAAAAEEEAEEEEDGDGDEDEKEEEPIKTPEAEAEKGLQHDTIATVHSPTTADTEINQGSRSMSPKASPDPVAMDTVITDQTPTDATANDDKAHDSENP